MRSSDSDAPQHGVFSHRPSMLAIALSLFLVAGTILFGIYGPSVASRLNQSGGVALAEVLDEAAELRVRVVFDTLQLKGVEDLNMQEAVGQVRQFTGRTMVPRDLTALGYHLQSVNSVQLPGAKYHAVALVYRGKGEASGHWFVLFLAADDEQFLWFDSVGRAHPLMTESALDGVLVSSSSDDGVALIWSDGPLLYVACFEDAAQSHALRNALDAP